MGVWAERHFVIRSPGDPSSSLVLWVNGRLEDSEPQKACSSEEQYAYVSLQAREMTSCY